MDMMHCKFSANDTKMIPEFVMLIQIQYIREHNQMIMIIKNCSYKCCEMICIVWQHVAASTGTGEGDLKKLCAIIEAVPNIKYICVDVANGYSEHFVQFVRDVRKTFPKHTIMVMTVEKGKKILDNYFVLINTMINVQNYWTKMWRKQLYCINHIL